MTNSPFQIIYDYVKANPKKSVAEISTATGLKNLTVHRYLKGGRAVHQLGIFARERITYQLPPDKNGIVRGGYCFLYSLNPHYEPPKPIPTNYKERSYPIYMDPITAALFGHVA